MRDFYEKEIWIERDKVYKGEKDKKVGVRFPKSRSVYQRTPGLKLEMY